MAERTRELCLKLLTSLHLNVEERAELPGGGAPFTELVAAVRERLESAGWFPSRPEPDGMIGEGALLELRGADVWLHRQHEIGVGCWSPVVSEPVPTIRDAVRMYIDAHGGAPMDGVPIDWAS